MSEPGVARDPVSIEETLAFVDHLRLRGWKIGVDQDLAIRRVCKESASTREATPDRVKVWLAATLAHDPREQNAIFVLFESWLSERRKQRQRRFAPAPVTPEKRPTRQRRGLAFAASAVIFIVALLLAWIFYQMFTPASSPLGPNPPPSVLEQSVKEESQGTSAVVVLATVIGATVGLAFAALLFFRHGRRMQLRAVYGNADAFEQHLLNVSGQTVGESLNRGLWRELRVLRPIDAADLDVERTIDATLRSGGCFAPVYKARKRSPEYVILLDRVSAGDHLSAIFEALVEHLQEGDIPLTSYTFHSDPRVCWNVDRPEEVFSLRDIAALHQDDRLVLLTDGAGLIDPYRGRPYRWVEWFSVWPERAIVTPVPRHDRGARERALGEAGFAFVTAADREVMALAFAFDTTAQHEVDDELDVPGIPRTIARDPRRWLDRESPDDDEVRTMRRQLRASLGMSGYRWLCACAVYPALEPRLTRFVGHALGTTAQPLLLAISRLPWFRSGRMPDWVRLAFISDLSESDEKTVREALGKLIDSCIDSGLGSLQSGLALPISTRVSWLARVLRRMRIGDTTAALPAGSDFHDRVFLDFMDGRKLNPLQFEVKEFVAAMLKRRKADSKPLRPSEPDRTPIYAPMKGAERTVMIVLSYLGLLALIPRIVARRRDPEVAWHASNGLAMLLVFYAGWLLQMLVERYVPFVGCGLALLSCIVSLTYFVGAILGMVRGFTGRRLRVWLVAPLADKIAGVKPEIGAGPSVSPSTLPRSEVGAAAAVIIAASLIEWVHANVLIGATADAFASSIPTHRLFAIVSLLLSIPAAVIADRLNAHARSALIGMVMVAAGGLTSLGPIPFMQYLAIALIAVGSALVRPSLVAYLGKRFSTDASGSRFYVPFTLALVAAHWLGSAMADVSGTQYFVAIVPIAAVGAFVLSGVPFITPQRHVMPIGSASWEPGRRNVIVFTIAFASFAVAIGICRVASGMAPTSTLDHSAMAFVVVILGMVAAAASARDNHRDSGLPKGGIALAYGSAVVILLAAASTTVIVDAILSGGLAFVAQLLAEGAILLTLARTTGRHSAAITAVWLALLDGSLLAPALIWPGVAVLTLIVLFIAIFAGITAFLIWLVRSISRRSVPAA